MKTLYAALLTLVMWLFSLMAFIMLMMSIFGSKSSLFPAVVILSIPALGAWYLRKRAVENQHHIGAMFPQRILENNNPEEDIRCPHCQAAFDEMPKRKRRCPHCKEWIWPMRPPGMQHKRLTTVEQALAWKLEHERTNPLDVGFGYARELARQGKPFQQALHDAHRKKLLEYLDEGIKTVVVSPAPDRCAACGRTPKKRIKVADELLNQRLPCLDCTSDSVADGWCRCDYLPFD